MDHIFSFALGVLASAIAGAWVQPLLTSLTKYHVVIWLAKIPALSGKMSGLWIQKWEVMGSEVWPTTNKSEMELRQIGSFIAADWTATTREGTVCSYRLSGRIVRDTYVSGIWFDRDSTGYFGSFLLRLRQDRGECKGLYMGNRSNAEITAFNWKWEAVPRYGRTRHSDCHGDSH